MHVGAQALTGTTWRYIKVPQKVFEKLQPADFPDLMALEVTPPCSDLHRPKAAWHSQSVPSPFAAATAKRLI